MTVSYGVLPQMYFQIPKGGIMNTEPTISLVNFIFILLFIMLISGIIGGLANYFMITKGKGIVVWKELLGYVILGIVASFVVPLFLNMISSNLLITTQTQPINFFIIASFCLIAAVFSKSFLENIYSKLGKELDRVSEEIELVKEADADHGNSDEETHTTGQTTKTPKLNETEKKVVAVIKRGKYTFRSVAGLQKETKIPINLVNETVKSLLDKNIAKKTHGLENRELVYLSPIGKDIDIDE
jgi:hypothetical protein